MLETADEYFDYYRKCHAFWKMYGLDLPDEVLKKLYYKNALRIIPASIPPPFRNLAASLRLASPGCPRACGQRPVRHRLSF